MPSLNDSAILNLEQYAELTGATFTGALSGTDLTLSGNLSVGGSTFYVQAPDVRFNSNTIIINNSSNAVPASDVVIEVERGDSPNPKIRWNETSDRFEITNDGTNYGLIITSADSGTITGNMISDGTIVNAEIASNAAIAISKLETGTAGRIVLANASGVPTYTEVTGDISIASNGLVTIAANSVALGTDTTGNYMSDVTAGTGVTITHTPGEGSNATISIGQAVNTNSNVTFNDVTVSGNLVVQGTTVTISANTLTIADNHITLNNDVTGTPVENAGFEVERGTSLNVELQWNEGSDKWQLTNDGTNYGDIVSTYDVGTVTSNMIADGTILNADINANAAIALSKLATGTAGNILVYNSSGVLTSVAESGDISISDTGVASANTSSIATLTATQTLTNKTLTAPVVTYALDTKTGNYTLVLTDQSKVIEMNVGSANTISVPTNSSVAFPIGTQIHITQYGAGKTQVVAVTPATTTIRSTPGAYLRAQYSSATLIKRGTDEWYLVGDLSAT
jgi:hypothetical protein